MTNNASSTNIRWSSWTIAGSVSETSCSSATQASWRRSIGAGCTSSITRL